MAVGCSTSNDPRPTPNLVVAHTKTTLTSVHSELLAGVTAPQSETPENFDLALGEFSVCSTTHFPDFGACRMQRNLNGQSPILERMVFYLNDCSKI
jgi:hypothetical protein